MPAPCATMKKKAIAIARISIGKISLTVKYAALAPAEAKKNISDQSSICVDSVNAFIKTDSLSPTKGHRQFHT